MKRYHPIMLPAELQAWRKRHGYSLTTGAQALGVSRRMFADYLNGTYMIPWTIAILCAAIDKLKP